MAYQAVGGSVHITVNDQTSSSYGEITMAMGDKSVPSLEALYGKSVVLAPLIRSVCAGGMNRITARVRYADPTPNAALIDAEIERKAALEILTQSGNLVKLSIPGVKPSLFNMGTLDITDPGVAAVVDLLINGLGGVIPVDSHGDQFASVSKAYKQHIRSLKG